MIVFGGLWKDLNRCLTRSISLLRRQNSLVTCILFAHTVTLSQVPPKYLPHRLLINFR